MITKFLNELNKSNSSNYKLEILKKYKDSSDIVFFLKMVYDKISFKYNIRNTNLDYDKTGDKPYNKEELSNLLQLLYTRQITGNQALDKVQDYIYNHTKEANYILKCILDRDIHSNVSTKSIEKVFKDMFFKMPYMRCSLIDKLKHINFPAFLQVKADGTYRTFVVEYFNNSKLVTAYSRSSEEYSHPQIFNELKNLPQGAYIGELIVNINDKTLDAAEIRYKSNGLLNSKNPPEDVKFIVWDYLTLQELQKKSSNTPYKERFETLSKYVKDCKNIEIIKSFVVLEYKEAQDLTRNLISAGEEGSVLKDFNAPFEGKTSNYQIKLKQEIEVDLECVGFTEGNGRFKNTFGAILFKSADNKVQGQCSGLPDNLRNEISKNKESYIGKIFSVKANDLTKSKTSETYGLMHPQFKGFRNDKTIADDLQRIQNMLRKF